METHFLDTGYIIALESEDDQNHQKVSSHWQSFIKNLPPLLTTSYVLDEILTFFNSRNRHAKAVEVGMNLLTSQAIELIHVNENLFYEGWKYFQKHDDKRYSLTDCISFVVMQNLEIRKVLTIDKHFAQAGFVKIPE
ncbi:PIN domain-containing protein [soil metagenome]